MTNSAPASPTDLFSGDSPHAADLALIGRLADAARDAVAPFFRAEGLGIDDKATIAPVAGRRGFDPVTEADRAIERAIRDILAAERPEDGVLGEEYDQVDGVNGRRWVIDPIDGTRAFMSGLPMWGVLIALEIDGKATLGAMDQPYTRERFLGVRAADGVAARFERDGQRARPLATRACARLADAVMFATAPEIFTGAGEWDAFLRVRNRVKMPRYGTDCYGYAMVAAGCADLVIEAGLAPYDIQAMIAIVEGAGGVVTTWEGGPAEAGGRVIAAGDRRLHAEAIAALAEA